LGALLELVLFLERSRQHESTDDDDRSKQLSIDSDENLAGFISLLLVEIVARIAKNQIRELQRRQSMELLQSNNNNIISSKIKYKNDNSDGINKQASEKIDSTSELTGTHYKTDSTATIDTVPNSSTATEQTHYKNASKIETTTITDSIPESIKSAVDYSDSKKISTAAVDYSDSMKSMKISTAAPNVDDLQHFYNRLFFLSTDSTTLWNEELPKLSSIQFLNFRLKAQHFKVSHCHANPRVFISFYFLHN
jgi:hypothetical protein